LGFRISRETKSSPGIEPGRNQSPRGKWTRIPRSSWNFPGETKVPRENDRNSWGSLKPFLEEWKNSKVNPKTNNLKELPK